MKIHTPPMQFKSPETAAEWDSGLAVNQDPYGNAVYQYASEWATRMEAAIAVGETVEQCAKRCSLEFDSGITVFMYGCAVGMLAAWWIHGEQLRRWHNRDTQIGTEGDKANESGGVLNPAIISIQLPD